MTRGDFYAPPFGLAYSTYQQHPWLSRLISWTIFGGDTLPYFKSMSAVAEAREGSVIVDCPCGAGAAFRELAPSQAVRYVGVDLSPSMLGRAERLAAKRNLPVELMQARRKLSPSPSRAPTSSSPTGLHCFPDPAAALGEAARVLRPAGRLVGSTFVEGTESLRQRLLIRPWTSDFGPIGSAREIVSWIEAAGFSTPTIMRSGPLMYFAAHRA